MPLKDPEARRAYHRQYMRKWYAENRELQKQRVLKANRERRERGKHYVDELKKQACTDCGVLYPPYVMDFDHVRGEKSLNLSRLRNGRLAWSRLLAEIEKCEVVCANCHRSRTHYRRLGETPPAMILAEAWGEGYVLVPIPRCARYAADI